jgi:hypothetical protein
MVEVVSEDGALYTRDRVFPFPIEARNGECRLLAELVTKDRNFAITGIGFAQAPILGGTSSEDDGKGHEEWHTACRFRWLVCVSFNSPSGGRSRNIRGCWRYVRGDVAIRVWSPGKGAL